MEAHGSRPEDNIPRVGQVKCRLVTRAQQVVRALFVQGDGAAHVKLQIFEKQRTPS